MRTMFFPLLVMALLTAAPIAPSSAREPYKVHVVLEPGSKTAIRKGAIKGDETIDYVLRARRGQYLNVSLATKHGATYFNILPPGSNTVAMHIGSISGNQFEGILQRSGSYIVRVYMMRSAARRQEVAKYRLELIIDAPPK